MINNTVFHKKPKNKTNIKTKKQKEKNLLLYSYNLYYIKFKIT